MPDRIGMHAPTLVNTLGHSAGFIVFAILLYLLVADWRTRRERGVLAAVAAGLSMLWNLGALIATATTPGDQISDALVAASFAVLSLLPAVLLHCSLSGRRPIFVATGYLASSVAIALHIADALTKDPRYHVAAILVSSIAFGVLAIIALALEFAGLESEGRGRNVAGAMALLVLALSFAHFRSGQSPTGWVGEALVHHAALPLSLLVILRDYRFLLLDTFIRFLGNAALSMATVALGLLIYRGSPPRSPFGAAFLFVVLCLLISGFAFARQQVQLWITRVVFLRSGSEFALSKMRAAARSAENEVELLKAATEVFGETFSSRATLLSPPAGSGGATGSSTPAIVFDPLPIGLPSWVRAVAPVRFMRGDAFLICLGSRAGGRRYLSEDLKLLTEMAATICERVERLRSNELESLVIKAELQALQAQINPHFFFNALNTLYGSIPRDAPSARRLVLNLSELFRASFSPNRTMLRLEEEIRLVRAYLDIEQLRLGERLDVLVDVDEQALDADVPALTIQPLVENAVKHGAGARSGRGFVHVRVRKDGEKARVTVSNSGSYAPGRSNSSGNGVGLENVRRRLKLCFGAEGALQIESKDDSTLVRFDAPLHARTAL